MTVIRAAAFIAQLGKVDDISLEGIRSGLSRSFWLKRSGQAGKCSVRAYTAFIIAGTPTMVMARLRL